VNVSISINGQEQLDQTLLKFTGITGEEVASASTQPTREVTAKHFYTYATAHPNKFGATSTGYWVNAGDNTVATSSGAVVNIEVVEKVGKVVGVRRHYTGGGTIKPSGRISEITGKPIQYLTIPINGAAHGKTVAMMRTLGVDLYRKGSALFAKSGGTRSDSDVAMFALKKSVGPQTPNPSIIPTPQQYFETVATVVKKLTEP
jgi:hypothetical protein